MNGLEASDTASIGVGIDTSRYGHHVTFLRNDLQPAAKPLAIKESREGYDQLQRELQRLHERHGGVVFHIRLDVAGQYATNLEAFLQTLPLQKTVSVGDPVRNRNYRIAHFPKRKADEVESRCAARFAVLERPATSMQIPAELRALRDVASRLEAQTREVTRHVNQLHNLLARVFPELATIVRDVGAGFVLELLKKYPTPARIAKARLDSITAIPHVRRHVAARLHSAARTTIGSLSGNVAETLVLALVRQIRSAKRLRRQFERLLADSYEKLPFSNHLESIPGIGVATAAVLTAKIITIDRFDRPEQLVGYFGIFPEERSSGIRPDGQPRAKRATVMSQKGNSLVRYYLYNAAMAAVRCNPAVRPLYCRLRGRGVSGNAALGHAMRKLLHLAFAVWKSGRPFDPNHYPWGQCDKAKPAVDHSAENGAEGHKQDNSPNRSVVSTAPPSTVRTCEGPVKRSAPVLLLKSIVSLPVSEAPAGRSGGEDPLIQGTSQDSLASPPATLVDNST